MGARTTSPSAWRVLLGAAMLCIPATSAVADVGPPAHLQVTEREAGIYFVQWRVPTVLPARAVPEPLLPDSCSPAGDVSVDRMAGAWLFTQDWGCESGLGGQTLGLRFPFPDLALTTVIRVNLRSGDRFAHVLSQGEGPWQVPEGTAAPDRLREAQRAVLAGIRHAVGSGIHLVFLLVLGLLGGWRPAVRLVTAFSLAQLASALTAALPGWGPALVPVEIGFGVAVALLAREVLRPPDERRRLTGLAAVAGLMHGFGLGALLAPGAGEAGPAARVLAIVGMDAFHLAGALGAAGLCAWWARPGARARAIRLPAYAAGTAAVAMTLAVALDGSPTRAGAPAAVMPGAAAGGGAAAPASRRVAPTSPDAAIQSFLAVEPFEVRHEVMLRLPGLTPLTGLDPAATVAPADQPALIDTLARFVMGSARVGIDGAMPDALLRRADFLVVDDTGALPRPNPVPEPVSAAVVGVTLAYPAGGMAGEVVLSWDPFPEAVPGIPATVIDPESVGSLVLSADKPSLTWENALLEDPIPTVSAVEVQPVRVRLPWLALPLLALCVVLPVMGIRRGRTAAAVAATRIFLALAILVGPLVQTTAALPGSAGGVPSERQARRILAGLLPNVYRALEYREEAAIYDRLAVSVTGETLTDIYLDQRRALELEERGGAQARVEAVEVLEASDIQSAEPGFEVRAVWTVGGMVTHFGHRHFRQNRYDARVGVVPVEGAWKIRSIEVLEQERLR